MCSVHLNELVLLSLGVDMTSSCIQMTVAWLLGCTCTPLSQHLWLSLEWTVSLSSITWRSWHMLTRFSCPLVSRQGSNLVTVWNIFRLPFKVYWTDPNKFPNTLTTSQIDIPSVFEDTVLHLIQIFMCFPLWQMSRVFSISHRHQIAFQLGKQWKHFCPSHCLLSKTYFQHLYSGCSIFNWWKHTVLSNLSFLRYARITHGTTHFYLTRYYSTTTLAIDWLQEMT